MAGDRARRWIGRWLHRTGVRSRHRPHGHGDELPLAPGVVAQVPFIECGDCGWVAVRMKYLFGEPVRGQLGPAGDELVWLPPPVWLGAFGPVSAR